MEQNNEGKSTRVAATPIQAEEARDQWWWVERCVWTERMLTRLTSGEPANRKWFAQRGLLCLEAEHEWTRTTVALRTH